jgi:TolA-binding protein
MKYMLPVLWAFCFLFSCGSTPIAGHAEESNTPLEMMAGPMERETPSGPEAEEDDEIPSVSRLTEEPAKGEEEFPGGEPEPAGDWMADLLKEEETPEIILSQPFPLDEGEVAALPEPFFSVQEEPEAVAAPIPEPPSRLSEPLVMNEPPVLDIKPEPVAEVVQIPPAAPVNPPDPPLPPQPKLEPTPPKPVPVPPNPPQESPRTTVPSPSKQEPPPKPAPAPPNPPQEKPRAAAPSTGIRRDPLPLPTGSVPNLPARETPVSPAAPASEGKIEFSRIVHAAIGQTIEIPFQGTGWVYLGELRSRSGVAYNSRRSDSEGQTFIFRAEETGTFGLKFYKQDYIRDYILNDHVQVIVDKNPERESGSSKDNGRVIIAPRWPYLPREEPPAEIAAAPTGRPEGSRTEAAPKSPTPAQNRAAVPQTPAAGRPPVRAEGADNDAIAPVTPPQLAEEGQPALPEEDDGPDSSGDIQPEEYFRKAREAFEGGQIEPALAVLDQFRQRYPLGSDEAWWLYGQFLEAAGPSRDIRLALDYYRRLVREYPQSPRYNDARGRIAYLERFYFNIR